MRAWRWTWRGREGVAEECAERDADEQEDGAVVETAAASAWGFRWCRLRRDGGGYVFGLGRNGVGGVRSRGCEESGAT